MKAILYLKLFIAPFVLLFTGVSSQQCYNSDDEFDDALSILFYSPASIFDTLIRQQLVLYWYFPHLQSGDDIVAVYYGDPYIPGNEPLMRHKPIGFKGFVKTGVNPSKALYQMNTTFQEECTGYYSAWLRNDVVRKTKCLSTHPDWMSRRKKIIGRMELRELFLPGTHDSGAYSEEKSQSIVQRYSVTQDRDIFDQLISGARYLDLRPARYGNEYWVNHGTYQMHPFDDVLYDIKEFMSNTDEIVVLGFKEFPVGFETMQDHKKFINYLERELAGFYTPRRRQMDDWVITLNEIWATGKRLILSYDHELQWRTESLWFPVLQQWGDVRTIHDLKTYLDKVEKDAEQNYHHNYPRLRAAMAEVTLSAKQIILDGIIQTIFIGPGGIQSLRQLGVRLGPILTGWYNEYYYSSANVVAVDFLDATGIVEIAIEWNDRRASNCYQYYKDLHFNHTEENLVPKYRGPRKPSFPIDRLHFDGTNDYDYGDYVIEKNSLEDE